MLDVQHVPKESDSSAIMQLSMALQGVRKEIEADLIKEQAILLALKNLDVDVSELVDPSPDPASPESDFSKILRVPHFVEPLSSPLDSCQSAGGNAQERAGKDAGEAAGRRAIYQGDRNGTEAAVRESCIDGHLRRHFAVEYACLGR
jgi:hypothetical protein